MGLRAPIQHTRTLVGVMPAMRAAHGRATSGDHLRPKAPALTAAALTVELSRAHALEELMSLQQSHGDRFDGLNLTAFWSRFKTLARNERGWLRAGGKSRLAPACKQTLRMLPTLQARSVANVAHSFASASLIGTGPWQSVWTALPEVVYRWLGDFKPQELSNTAWAFAKSGRASPSVFAAISAEVAGRSLGGFNPQDLANTAWAFAKAGHAPPALFDAISAEVVRRHLGDFKPQELSNTVRRNLGDFKPQELSNTAWAFATAGHGSPALFEALATEVARRRLGMFTPQALSNTVWAFQTAAHAAPALFDAISTEATLRLGDFKPQELSVTAWAYASAAHPSPTLLDAIAAETLRRRLSEFNPQNLSNTAWAFATSGHAAPELFDSLAAEFGRRRLCNFTPQSISNMAWALAVFDPPAADEAFGTAGFAMRCAQLETAFSSSELRQLHQWSLWRQERGASWPALSEPLQRACRDAFVTQEGNPSQMQCEVVRAIMSKKSGALAVSQEFRCEVTGYSIDALVTLNDEKHVAVEVDGPFHFLGSSQQPTGATLLKQRQLRHFGWNLVSVPYWDRTKCLTSWLPHRTTKE